MPATPTSTRVIKASINSIPIEIKTQIVKLANLQDENYSNRRSNDENEVATHEYEEEVEEVLKYNKWRGKSLNSLFLVNKEWSNLAAVHLFRELRGQRLGAVVFKFSILFHRKHFIKSINFSTARNPIEMLHTLFGLPHIYELELSIDVSIKLFGDSGNFGKFSNYEVEQRFSAFRTIAPRITILSLYGHNSNQANQIRSVFPNLKKLTLDSADLNPEGLLDLGNLLANYSSLQSLSLVEVSNNVFSSWENLDWKSSLTLRSLELGFDDCDTGNDSISDIHFNFSNIFSNSLTNLTLLSFQDSLPANYSLPNSFTKLQYLCLQATDLTIPTLVKLFRDSPIVSVFIGTPIDDFPKPAFELELSLILFVKQHNPLQFLEFQDRFNRRDHFSKLIKICAEKRIVLVFSIWNGQTLDNFPLRDCRDIDYRKPVLKEALRFGQMRLLELEKENDMEGMTEMFDNCKWLRASAAERKD